MKVFLSWSGEKTKSHAVARALDEWLPTVLNAVEPWISSRGLIAGLQWNQQLDKQLEDTSFGIIVVTPWNQHSQWLSFEAGALSKRVGGSESRVAPLLIDFPNVAKLTGPLSGYQVVLPTEDGIRALVSSLNQALGEISRSHEAVERAFDVCWPALQTQLEKIDREYPSENDPAEAPTPQPVAADDADMLSEILNAVRGLARSDARLANELRNSARKPHVSSAQDRPGIDALNPSIQKRLVRRVRELGFAPSSIQRNLRGDVTLVIPAPLSPDEHRVLVDGLDWDELGIKSLTVVPHVAEDND